mgnify:CR=1 FL=1
MKLENKVNIAHSLLMVRPIAFGPNPETASTNAFQSRDIKNVQNIGQEILYIL